MKFFKVPFWVPLLFPHRIWHLKPANKNKVIYLTFDDGPTENLTGFITGQLKKHNARATFFCVGKNAEKYPEKIQYLLDEGHSIGNHTYTHRNGYKTELLAYIKDVKNAAHSIKTNLFRPPYGKLTQNQAVEIHNMGFKIIMWDILSYDFAANLNIEKAYNKIIKAAKPGSIIVLHDNEKARKNLEILLPRLLKHFSAAGYSFEPICL